MPVTRKIKETYLFWHNFHLILPKTHRYTLGNRVDEVFIELIESVSAATFLKSEEKLQFLKIATRKLDTLKLLLMILWETKSIDNKKYLALSLPIEEIGKMLGGWLGQLTKQNPTK